MCIYSLNSSSFSLWPLWLDFDNTLTGKRSGK